MEKKPFENIVEKGEIVTSRMVHVINSLANNLWFQRSC